MNTCGNATLYLPPHLLESRGLPEDSGQGLMSAGIAFICDFYQKRVATAFIPSLPLINIIKTKLDKIPLCVCSSSEPVKERTRELIDISKALEIWLMGLAIAVTKVFTYALDACLARKCCFSVPGLGVQSSPQLFLLPLSSPRTLCDFFKMENDPVMSIPIPPPRLPIFLRTGDKSQYACLCARLIRSPKAMNPDMMLRVPQPIDIPWSMEFSRRSIA
jgi:hypothetical protein